MKVVILGAGVVGVTTAYYLNEAGHEVTVLDRQAGPGMETSFANTGEIAPGCASPWAAPGLPLQAIKWLMVRHAPLVLRPRLDPAMWVWLARMLRNCTSGRYTVNKARMVSLAEYSRDRLRELRSTTDIQYDEASLGSLQLFRTQKQLDNTAADVEVLKRFGVPYELLDPAGCVAKEPALSRARGHIAGGLRLPSDEAGDCKLFTQRLAAICEQRGVVFRFGTETGRLLRNANSTAVSCVTLNKEFLRADAYVMALGSHSARWMRKIDAPIPIYPVKGYSITLPVDNADAAPVSTVLDATHEVAITRLGNRIRVGGTVEISGYDLRLHETRRATLEHSVRDLFPDAADASQGTFWCGLRPMTPDGPPIIGRTPYRKLFINTGHGGLGWTMACGSAKILADIMSGREPEIDARGLGMERYS